MTLTINGQPTSKPLLTVGDVADWRDELAKIKAEIAAAQQRASVLERKLEAAAVFMPELVLAPVQVRSALPLTGHLELTIESSLSSTIESTVKASPRPMSPKMIRNAIAHGPNSAMLKSENYLYSAIKRLADKGKIIRRGDGYVGP